jgi:hypothetical protein
VAVRELLNFYVAMEEFVMEKDVQTAISIRELSPGNLTTSMVRALVTLAAESFHHGFYSVRSSMPCVVAGGRCVLRAGAVRTACTRDRLCSMRVRGPGPGQCAPGLRRQPAPPLQAGGEGSFARDSAWIKLSMLHTVPISPPQAQYRETTGVAAVQNVSQKLLQADAQTSDDAAASSTSTAATHAAYVNDAEVSSWYVKQVTPCCENVFSQAWMLAR